MRDVAILSAVRTPVGRAPRRAGTPRAAMGSGAQQTFRYIGSCAGVALTIAIATSAGSGLARGADIAMVVSAGLAVLAAASVVVLRERERA